MHSLLERLGYVASRRHWSVIGAWLLILITVVLLRGAFGGTYANDYTVPGSESSAGLEVLQKEFPQQGGYAGQIVFHANSGTLDANATVINGAMTSVSRLPHVLRASSPFAQSSSPLVSKDHTIAYGSTAWDVVPASLDAAYLDQLDAAVAPVRAAGVQVEYGGGAGQIGQSTDDLSSELIGLICALALLVLMFASIAAAARSAHRRDRRRADATELVLPTVPATTYVVGTTAGYIDFTAKVSSRMLLLILSVVALSFLLLMTAFRSIVIAAKAAVLNLLSVAAAYGVVVAVFQWGWGSSLVGIHEDLPIPFLRPDADVRDHLRAVHGLRGLPPVPDPRGVDADPRRASQRRESRSAAPPG